jgi:glutaconate CoA-transferase subunit A
VAVLHGLEGDRHGNVKLNNNLGVDMELVYLADTVIITVERVVENVEKSTDGVIVPSPGTTYLVHVPRGAWPTSCYPNYPLAGGEFMRYVDACNGGRFEEYVAEKLASQPGATT